MLRAVQKQAELESGAVLVACSGGLDSMVLADLAVEYLGVDRVVVAHVDHGVHRASADIAERVREWAQREGVRFEAEALRPGRSDEAGLRDLRYAALETMRDRAGAASIWMAHHREDQAETVLLGLLRVTQLSALAGIPQSRGSIRRPLLKISRHTLRRYAERRRVPWWEDPTNREPRYLRNRVRKELLPLLESRYRSRFQERLAALADEVRGAGRNPANTNATPGVESPWPWGIEIARAPYSGENPRKGAGTALFDAAVVEAPLVRTVRPGDRIQPFGMKGRRKLQDVLVDAKVPRVVRGRVPVVADENGEVLWVPGIVRSSKALVGSGTADVWVFRRIEISAGLASRVGSGQGKE